VPGCGWQLIKTHVFRVVLIPPLRLHRQPHRGFGYSRNLELPRFIPGWGSILSSQTQR
jgi:hypothetical protein